jgi:hypothetical protein
MLAYHSKKKNSALCVANEDELPIVYYSKNHKIKSKRQKAKACGKKQGKKAKEKNKKQNIRFRLGTTYLDSIGNIYLNVTISSCTHETVGILMVTLYVYEIGPIDFDLMCHFSL